MELWPLIDVRNWLLLNILLMNIQNLTKFCIYITIYMIYPPSVLLTVLCSWTYLCSLIVLWRGYGQILWQVKFLQVTRTTIKCHMSSKFDQIRPCSAALAALELLKKKSFTYLRTSQNIFMTCWLSGERSLPFGLRVVMCRWLLPLIYKGIIYMLATCFFYLIHVYNILTTPYLYIYMGWSKITCNFPITLHLSIWSLSYFHRCQNIYPSATKEQSTEVHDVQLKN